MSNSLIMSIIFRLTSFVFVPVYYIILTKTLKKKREKIIIIT